MTTFASKMHAKMIRMDDVTTLARQVSTLRVFSMTLLGDMAVDRGGPEDEAYMALAEAFEDLVERHAELVRSLGDGSRTSSLMLARVTTDYATRSVAFMGMRDIVNMRIRELAHHVAADPEDAARRIVDLQCSVLRSAPTRGPEPVMARTRSAPVSVVTDVCSICFNPCSASTPTVACTTCHKAVHATCLDEYRSSAGFDVRCPTCRQALS